MRFRCFFFSLMFLLICSTMLAQWEPPPKPQYKRDTRANTNRVYGRMGIGLGACLDPHQYPITDISCRVVTFKSRFLIDARLRAYGMKSVVNGRNYDFLAYMHQVKAWKNTITRYYGFGAAMNFRGGEDFEYPGTNGPQAMLMCGSMYYKKKFYFNVPVWAKFSLDGFDVSILPEPSYKVGDDAQLFLRYELSYHSLYSGGTGQLRHDALLGTYLYF